ncbi:MAG: aminotransferase class III-fold pyridoxal phosphate-dependent enzyme [Desulfobacterium sp.]|nr:aminotransferase class III-fold pyridoxal phosphate-dependent enzyme [Desulfobacterium sp.]
MTTTYDYSRSQELFQRAVKVIPCGVPGHMSPGVNVPPADYPIFTEKAKGAMFYDLDGNRFIDYMCAYGPMVLGYNNPLVDTAATEQLKSADLTMGASPKMVELAELLVDMVPVADWAFFAKNGGDVTNYATMIARTATNRKKIVMIQGGYHGVAPWMQPPGHHGLIEEDYSHIIRIPWNDVNAFQQAVDQYPDQIAGFIATPYHVPTFYDNELPKEGYWPGIELICRKNDIVLILDDIRHGFRLDMGGSCEYFGFKPDLICFCKALANGFPISALVGRESLKLEAAKIFYTGSYWNQAVPMAAAIACLTELKRLNAPAVMLENGEKLFSAMQTMAAGYGYDLNVTGAWSMPNIRITNDDSNMLHQQWCAECTKRGVFLASHHNLFMSLAHDEAVISQTLEIVDEAFNAL